MVLRTTSHEVTEKVTSLAVYPRLDFIYPDSRFERSRWRGGWRAVVWPAGMCD
jgi:hypothetical protein